MFNFRTIKNWQEKDKPFFKDEKLITIEDMRTVENNFREVNTKLWLILNHLNLRYIPETEKKEEARLEEKQYNLPKDFHNILEQGIALSGLYGITPKKKRGRPKKK